jgi:hypothetical protein
LLLDVLFKLRAGMGEWGDGGWGVGGRVEGRRGRAVWREGRGRGKHCEFFVLAIGIVVFQT